jgi:RNA polymerase sigma factor (sigma-70 family)
VSATVLGVSMPAAERDPGEIDALGTRFAAGDDGALRAVFDRYGPLVARLARASLADRSDVDDIVQNTFVSAWNARASYIPAPAGMTAWLLSITQRRVVDLLRSRERRRRDADAVEATPNGSLGSGFERESPERVVDRLVVTDQLTHLPLAQQQVLLLAFYGGLTHVEIAARTGLPVGTVKSHLRRGMVTLRARLDEATHALTYAPPEEVGGASGRGTPRPSRPR